MATTEEALSRLTAIETSLGKINTETTTLVQKVTDLQNAAQGNVPDNVMAKINDVAAQAQTVDDLVPDVSAQPPA